MKTRQSWTREQITEIHRQYLDSNLSVPKFAPTIGWRKENLYRWFGVYGLKGRPKKERYRLQAIHQRGPNGPGWKGGRTSTPDGYVLVTTTDLEGKLPPKQEREHRLVWEKAYGPLPKGWHVHHKNGIKSDNRLVNLEAMPSKQHYQYIPMLKRTIFNLEQQVYDNKLHQDNAVADY